VEAKRRNWGCLRLRRGIYLERRMRRVQSRVQHRRGGQPSCACERLWWVVVSVRVTRVPLPFSARAYPSTRLEGSGSNPKNEQAMVDGTSNDQTPTSCRMISRGVCILHFPSNCSFLFLLTHVPSAKLDPRLSRSPLHQVLQREESPRHSRSWPRVSTRATTTSSSNSRKPLSEAAHRRGFPPSFQTFLFP